LNSERPKESIFKIDVLKMPSGEDSQFGFPIALTIAGFDPSGEAGVLADARTFAAFGFHASAAITSLTFQNRARVFGAVHQSGEEVRAQMMPLLEGYKIVCSKIGMLPTSEIVREVVRVFRENDLPSPVVDPVINSTSGQRLMEEDALDSLISELLPVARLITPNIPEAEQLTGMSITSEPEMRQAAAMIRGLGARAVLIKGGHLGRQKPRGKQQTGDSTQETESEGDKDDQGFALRSVASDLLDDNGKVTMFRQERIQGGALHGSGCILSAAIAAGLGRKMTLEDSVSTAKRFVWEAIRKASVGVS
jgi:hydroxymethylpyrimidine kinase/phosphomethylpyrimidine kinase